MYCVKVDQAVPLRIVHLKNWYKQSKAKQLMCLQSQLLKAAINTCSCYGLYPKLPEILLLLKFGIFVIGQTFLLSWPVE